MKKEMIKAIRLVNGFNPDLRVKLTTINRSALWDWIDANRLGIFGLADVTKPSSDSPEWSKYERKIWGAVNKVINGTPDE